MDTGDKSLNHWIDFFEGPKKMTKFITLLKKLDKSYLSYESTFDFEHPLFEKIPKWGFLEKDFKAILRGMDEDGLNSQEEKTRLIIAMSNGVNFKNWISVYNEDLVLVFEKSLIDGGYEKYGIDLEKIVSIAIDNKLIDRSDFMGIALMRGIVLQNRYPDEESEKNLKKEIKKNKLKTLLHSTVIHL
jgi:hypothetical protein